MAVDINSSMDLLINKFNNKVTEYDKKMFGDEDTSVKQGSSFADILKANINGVNNLMLDSEYVANQFALGNVDNVHEVMIASTKAGLAFDLMLQIRTKLVDAYQEIMRIQM